MTHKIAFLTASVILATLASLTPRAYAQTYDKTHASTLILAGNSGADPINTATIVAPSLGSPFSFTLPAATLTFPGANASGILTNPGTGILTWTPLSYSSFPNEAAITLLGNPTGSPASTTAFGLGAGLGFSSNTLVNTGVISIANGGGITVTASTGAITLGSTATNLNTASAIVARDASGNFNAGTITAALSGNATSATTIATTLQAASASTFYPTFVPLNATNASQAASVATALSYVPSTGTLSATTFVGAVTGNATGFTGSLAGDVTGPQGTTAINNTAAAGNHIVAALNVATPTTPINVAAGGSGVATRTVHSIQVGNGTSAVTQLATGNAGQILTSAGGSSDPAWTTATYPSTTAASSLLYSNGANVVAALPTANGGVLNTSATGVPSITATPTLGVAGAGGTTGTLTFATSGAGNTGTSTIQAGAQGAVFVNYTLPTVAVEPTANQVLSVSGSPTGAGTSVSPYAVALAWTTPVGAVTSVSNSDGTLTISPTTGAVVASLALGNNDTWTGAQINAPSVATAVALILKGSATSGDVFDVENNAGSSTWLSVNHAGLTTISNGLTVSGGTVTLPATSIANAALQGSGAMTFTSTLGSLTPSGTVALGGSPNYDINLTHSNAWTAQQTFTNSTSSAASLVASNTFNSGATDIALTASTTNAAGAAVNVTSGNVRIAGLTASAPVFTDASKNLTSTGTVPVGNGGTGVANPTIHGVMVAEGASAMTPVTSATAGTVLTGTAGDPAFSATPTLGVAGSTAGTLTLASGAAAFTTQFATSATTPASTYIYQLPTQPTGLPTAGNVLTIGTPTGTGPYTVPLTWAAPTGGVTTFSAGTTGLTPSGATSGAITLGGTLISTNGGTGVSNPTAHAIMVAEGASAMTPVASATTGTVLTGTATDPAFSATPTLGVISSGLSPTTGSIALANASSANLTTIQGGNATAAVTYILPTTAPTSANQVLTANGTISPIQLSWGNGSQVFARRTTDTVLAASNTTLQTDNTLQLSLAANATYQFSGVINYDASGTGGTVAGDLKLAMNFVTGTLTAIRWSANQGGTAVSPSSVAVNATAITGFHVDPVTASNTQSVFVSGIVVVGGVAGTLQVQEAQNTSQAATTTIRSNSFLSATRVQ